MHILDTIVARKKEEVALLKKEGIGAPVQPVDPARGFTAALTATAGIAVIAEVKKASPSKGVICPGFDPEKIAASYQEGGADAVSVLTDVDFFQGSLDYIPLVRQTVSLPVIRKDFIIHELQIRQAAAYGADAILLIGAILSGEQIRDYLQMSAELGLDVLVEVHDERELEKSLGAGSRLIGINNRDLRDFTVDLNTTVRLRREIPAEIPVVSESGIRGYDDMKMLQDNGIAAALVGETLMRSGDPAATLRELRGR
ncbi:MAG: indole-3-glycerol phosphate synthase TrpC [Deltaproteobacteria bacterium]|jgi:indole-3-glycerol phosphate synthase|nr:indole-3-glycerol phosphate synthase TrpC [Deltaproteobacteria bacterium]